MSDSGGAAAGGAQQSMSAYLDGGGGGAVAVVAPQQQRNREAAKLTFPDVVPVATRDAVLSYEAPLNRRIRPLNKKQRSGVVYYGVRLDIVLPSGEVDPNNKLFACLASVECRNARTMLKLKAETTTGATSHLKDTHKINMPKTTATHSKQVEVTEKKASALKTQAYNDDPSRYHQIQFVKSFIISSACPFSIGDNPHVRHCLSLMCPDKLDVQRLNNKAELGIFEGDDSDDDNGDDEQPGLQDAREEAEGILQTWIATKFSPEQKGLSAAEYWRVHGSRHPPALRAVARAVFGCPASAGVIERDFCIADWFMPRKRGSLDPAFLEMCLYLRAQSGLIANDVPVMSETRAKEAFPSRLRNADQLAEVNVLSLEAEKESYVVVEDDDALWALPLSANSGEQDVAVV